MHYTVFEKILLNIVKNNFMKLANNGFDENKTYFEHNINSTDIPSIFIHGVGLDNTMWLPQKKYFNNNQVIFYDLLNHGKSCKNYFKLSFENFSEQLNELTNYLNIKKFNLIGFSIGALIAQHFTSQYYEKINKLIIIASIYKRTYEQIEKIKNRYKIALNGDSITNDSIKRWFNSSYLRKNPSVHKYFFDLLENKKSRDFLPAYKLFVDADNYYLDFSNFNMPTLIMTGENELGSTPEMSKMLNNEINNSELYIIPDAKHMATYEKNEIVNLKILNFIN